MGTNLFFAAPSYKLLTKHIVKRNTCTVHKRRKHGCHLRRDLPCRLHKAHASIEEQGSLQHDEDGENHSSFACDGNHPEGTLHAHPRDPGFDRIAEDGANMIQSIGTEAKEALNRLEHMTEESASRLIEEETQAILKSYDEKQETLLRNIASDREVILNEADRMKELADQMMRMKGNGKHVDIGGKAILVACVMLTLSSLYYAVIGLSNSDPQALQNGGIDALFAACSGYLLSRRNERNT